MADQTFMFMVVAFTMIGLAVLLFVSKGLRVRSSRSIDKEHNSASTTSSSFPNPSRTNKESYNNVNRKAKKYTSDGKPVYED